MKRHDNQRGNWIQFLEKRISLLVVKGACPEKIKALKGNLKRLRNGKEIDGNNG